MNETDRVIEETFELYQEYLNKWKNTKNEDYAIKMRKALSLLQKMCKRKRIEVQEERTNATTK